MTPISGKEKEGVPADEAREFLKDESFDAMVYRRLASLERDPDRRRVLFSLAETEERHCDFWRQFTDFSFKKPRKVALLGLVWMRRLLGLVFTMKFLELHERKVVQRYRELLPRVSPSQAEALREIIKDEEEHEKFMMTQVEDPVVKYVGFVALGLSDAIIEITGVHAGFLGVARSTLVAGVAGLIVGFAASISMGVAAYLKAKSEVRGSPLALGSVTAVSYLVSVVVLALPYFLTPDMALAFGVSVVLAVALSVSFSFYVSVLNEVSFKREALENTLLLFGTALATYFFGELLGQIFGIKFASG
ncbi:MAG: VIT1/CCC1 family protein [Fimbriimonadales bacterium]|nr:VIT1/CCC1 family protein [Fimbriimonadales bacterium]